MCVCARARVCMGTVWRKFIWLNGSDINGKYLCEIDPMSVYLRRWKKKTANNVMTNWCLSGSFSSSMSAGIAYRLHTHVRRQQQQCVYVTWHGSRLMWMICFLVHFGEWNEATTATKNNTRIYRRIECVRSEKERASENERQHDDNQLIVKNYAKVS